MSRRPRTFRRRLAFSMSVLCLCVLAAAGLGIYFGVRSALKRNLDAALLAIARTEIASAFDGPGESPHLHEPVPSALTLGGRTEYEKLAQIKDVDGRVRVQSANLVGGPPLRSDPRLEALALAGQASVGNLLHGGERCRAAYLPMQDEHGHRFVVILAISRHPLDLSLERLAFSLLASVGLAGAAAALGSMRLASWLTRPLERIANAARAVGDRDLAARIPVDAPDVELRDVARTLNEMLERLQSALDTERQLLAAQRRFLADASHELRSPLTNLRAALEIALRHPREPEEYRETIAAALPEVARLARLVADLLTLSRAEAGQLSLGDEPCDLAGIAADAVRACAAGAATRGVGLELDAPEPLALRGDPDRLREVVDNLLDNALHVAPVGSTVRVAAAQRGAELWLSVLDRGPGLAPDAQALVFERFWRADAGRSRNSGGSGLGLAIARAIAEAHGGRIALESRPGAGATFSLVVPAPRGSGGAAEDSSARPDAGRGSAAGAGR